MAIWFPWLCLLLFFPSLLYSFPSPPSSFPRHPPQCHHFESSALLQFKNSLSIIEDNSHRNSTTSWDIGKDCCIWSGITCDEMTGHVISLDLEKSGLQGVIHSNSSLFVLTSLQSLILSSNSFDGSEISPQFGRFVNMIHLNLSHSGFTGQVPLEISYLSSLVTLDLSLNFDLRLESFSLKQIVGNLTSLKELSLSFVNMHYVSPNSFMNLSASLTSLDLSFCGMEGEFPENIFHLPNLLKLDLTDNSDLTGSFPGYNWTSPLKSLSLSYTEFLVDIPHLTRNLKFLNYLHVANCGFRVPFPAFVGNITQITSLDLSYNNFGGQIPLSYLNLEELTYLDLSYNNFKGQLPEICSNSTRKTFLCDSSHHDRFVGPLPSNLESLFLSGNLLNGTIPSWLYSLPSLGSLCLGRNQFTGHLGEFKYNSLVTLELDSNKLQGLIPRSIFRQVNLFSLDLSFNSLSLDSSIISAFPNTLWLLGLSSCNLSEFPHSLRSLDHLGILDLSSNRIEGSVPDWLWNNVKDSLFFLNISHNLLTHIGKIPLKKQSYIDLSSNRLQGHLPIPQPSTVMFLISNNQLVGEISSLFCNLRLIQILDLSNNNLSGNIPPCLGYSSNHLFVLDVRMNRFHGIIPPTFAKGNSLATLNLNGNQLEGSLPHSLLNCGNLKVLDVGNNRLNGSFPFWLESLPELQVLILRANSFSGTIRSKPKVKFPFQKMRVMDLSNNEFTGLLPAEYFGKFVAMVDAHADHLEYMIGNVNGSGPYYYQDSVTLVIKGFDIKLPKIQKMLMVIDFSSNNFTGEIPKVIGKLNSLKGLNLSHNKLTGVIPESLGNLTSIESLDLSSNELSGKIPWQLAANLNQLEILNLSNNKLEGPIPRGKQFDTFINDSFGGNPGLCGFPLSESCNNDEGQQDQGDENEEHSSGMIDWKVVMMGYASGLVIGISIGYMMIFSEKFDYWLLKRSVGGGQRCRTGARFRGIRRSN